MCMGAFIRWSGPSVIVSLMLQSSRPIKTFTIGFNEDDYNELYTKAVAKHWVNHTELYVTAKQVAVIPHLLNCTMNHSDLLKYLHFIITTCSATGQSITFKMQARNFFAAIIVTIIKNRFRKSATTFSNDWEEFNQYLLKWNVLL